MNLFGSLRRAWKRHDENLAETAYRSEGAEERLEAFDAQLGAAESREMTFAGTFGDGGMTAAIREEDELEHEHPPGEPA